MPWKMTRLFLPFCFCCLFSIIEAQNYLRNDVNFRLPKPFIISTTLGVEKPPNTKLDFQNINHQNVIKPQKTRKQEVISAQPKNNNERFYNFQDPKMNKLITSQPINAKSPKINFYSVNCLSGLKCNAIIPGPKTHVPPVENRTSQEMRTYLRRYGLENGFNYFDNTKADQNNAVANFFREEREERENARRKRRGRKINSFYDYDDFWPGSEYRPNRPKEDKSNSKAKIYKFNLKPFPNRNHQHANKWTHIRPSFNNKNKVNYKPTINFNKYATELPFPSFTDKKPPQISTKRPYSENSKGVWNRYSNSVISQYDKKRQDWVEISNSNTDFGGGYVNVNFKPLTQNRPSYFEDGHKKYQHAGGHLTVLGISEDSDPYQKPVVSQRPEYTPPHSSHHIPPYSDRPFPSIHSPTSPPNSVSFPLNVLPPDLSDPVLVFANEGINASLSNDSFTYNDTDYTYTDDNDYTDYIDLTKINTPQYYPPTTTRPPAPITRLVYITRPTQAPSISDTRAGGGGGGGGGGGAVTTNAYAIMAAVGAGLIPASIAAVLPVLLGRRKRRSLGGLWSSNSPSLPPPGGRTSLASEPILKFLLNLKSQNKPILR